MYEFRQNMEITYVNSPYAQKNPFLNAEIRLASLPTYDRARSLLPEIVWNGHEDAIACYNKAWETAFSKPLKWFYGIPTVISIAYLVVQLIQYCPCKGV